MVLLLEIWRIQILFFIIIIIITITKFRLESAAHRK